MAVVFGTIANGRSVSSAFTLQSTDRALFVAVSSHAILQWFASFQITPTGPFVRYLDPWTTNSNGAFMVAAGGGVGLVDYRPVPTMRIETNAAVSTTTSFCLSKPPGMSRELLRQLPIGPHVGRDSPVGE